MRQGRNFDDRYKVIIIILTVLMAILMVRLATLTLIEGDRYRDEADNKRIRDIPITAARGEIRDKNGKLLAGSKPSFAVQILKDEFEIKGIDERNEHLLKLIRLLEEDGVSYLDDFPIGINVFKYDNGLDENEFGLKAVDQVTKIIKENNLLRTYIRNNFDKSELDVGYDFSIGEKTIQYLRGRGNEIPIKTIKTENGIEFRYEEIEDLIEWKKEYKLSPSATPYEALVSIAERDNGVIREILNHPLIRLIVYKDLKSSNLIGNIILEEYNLTYDDEFTSKKNELMNQFDFITMETSAEEDFINIFKEISLYNFLNTILIEENSRGNEVEFIPGEKLLEMVRDKERIKVKLVKTENGIQYEYQGSGDKNKTAYETLIDTANKTGVMESFLKDDEIRGRAQSQLLRDGINTRISIADKYEYIFVNEKNIFYEQNKIPLDSSAKEAFYIIKEKYKIPEDVSKYETRAILSLYKSLSGQSYSGYNPINIAYGIQDKTVAKIEEGMSEVPGIKVSIEPVRYYPEGESTAHVIGQLGRISQQNEIDEFIKEKKYSPSEIIGKTGIEHSYQDVLRGENGFKKVEVDAFGNTINVLEEKKPVPGNNIYLSIDLEVQKKAEEYLRETLQKIRTGGTYNGPWGSYQMSTNRSQRRPYRNATSGATVAVDVKTGEVIALVSDPSYDPNLFSTGISSADWQELLPKNEKDLLAPRPLYNIATQTAVQPGSTFKPVIALAALDKGLSPDKKIRDMGYVEIGNQRYRCNIWKNGRGSHGYEDVYGAMRDSCNYYFYSLMLGQNQRTGESLGVKVEIEDIVDLTSKLGLNDKTGIEINIPGENHGRAPDPSRKASGTKNLLRYFLNSNIRDYIQEDKSFDDEELEVIIEEIVSWIYQDGSLSRVEVVNRLTELGISAERKLPNKRDSIADIIKYSYLDQASWHIGDSLNISIGQGLAEYTPIQMANAVATISNGGYNNTLTLIDNIKNYNNSKTIFNSELKTNRIELNNYENLEYIKKSMLAVSESGTSRRIFGNFPVKIGIKTGTAEKSGRNPATGELYDDFGWFIAFGPYDDPEIAVATVVFQGGSGGNAGPVTRDIIGEYLRLGQEEHVDETLFENKLTN